MTDHKRPHERTHLWERPAPTSTTPPVSGDGMYPLRLHKGLESDGTYDSRLVENEADEKAAKKDGFSRDVPLTPDQKAAVKAQSRADKQ